MNIPDVRLERLASVLVKSPDLGLLASTEIPQQESGGRSVEQEP